MNPARPAPNLDPRQSHRLALGAAAVVAQYVHDASARPDGSAHSGPAPGDHPAPPAPIPGQRP